MQNIFTDFEHPTYQPTHFLLFWIMNFVYYAAKSF